MKIEADTAYGALVEGVHLAGYSLERAFRKLEYLIDEKNLWKTVGGGYEDVNKFVATIRLDKFKALAEERKQIAARIKELQPEVSNKSIAKMLGAGSSTIDRDIAPDGASVTKKPNKNKGGKTSAAPNGASGLSGAAAAEAVAKAEDKVVRGTQGTGENEWYTPADIIADVRKVLGEIDLDPASSEHAQRTVQARRYFTLADDGLAQQWGGNVYLNPPYAQPFIENFADKIIAEREACRVTSAIMLTHNYTDTAWFQKLAVAAAAICFTKGRIRFESPEGELAAPTQGQAFFFFGKDPTHFIEVFSRLGFVVGHLT